MKLNVREAAELLSVPERDLYRWVAAGAIPFYRAQHQPVFSRAELLEWATSRRLPVTFAMLDDAGSGRAPLALAEALERGGIHRDVPGGDRAAVLRAVVERLGLPDPEERGLVADVWLARDVVGSTGIGEGIAIPHVRSPIVCAGSAGAVVLCFLQAPVVFAAGRAPLHTIFALVSPTIRAHLELLSKLSLALLDPAFKQAVLRRSDASAIATEARRVEASLAPARSVAP